MTKLHRLSDYRAGGTAVTAAMIADALKALGGAAHRDAMVNLLMGSLRHAIEKPALTDEVDRLLRQYSGEAGMFEQMFGPQSLRWKLGVGRAPEPAPRARVMRYPHIRRTHADQPMAPEPL